MPESRRRRSNRPHPPVGIQKAASVAQAITDNNAGHPMSRILLAEAMGRSPSSSGFRNRIAAAARYGLCKGNYNSERFRCPSWVWRLRALAMTRSALRVCAELSSECPSSRNSWITSPTTLFLRPSFWKTSWHGILSTSILPGQQQLPRHLLRMHGKSAFYARFPASRTSSWTAARLHRNQSPPPETVLRPSPTRLARCLPMTPRVLIRKVIRSRCLIL